MFRFSWFILFLCLDRAYESVTRECDDERSDDSIYTPSDGSGRGMSPGFFPLLPLPFAVLLSVESSVLRIDEWAVGDLADGNRREREKDP